MNLEKNSQQKDETKRDRGLALKALEDDSDSDEEEIAMITQKFKSSSRKSKKIANGWTSVKLGIPHGNSSLDVSSVAS